MEKDRRISSRHNGVIKGDKLAGKINNFLPHTVLHPCLQKYFFRQFLRFQNVLFNNTFVLPPLLY